MTDNLKAYLLCCEALSLLAKDDPNHAYDVMHKLADAMDRIWYSRLTSEERNKLIREKVQIKVKYVQR